MLSTLLFHSVGLTTDKTMTAIVGSARTMAGSCASCVRFLISSLRNTLRRYWSKHDLQARPIYHHLRDSIEAHLTIVFAALAVSRWIEHQTGWSVRRFVKTARRYRTIQIQAGTHTITAADPLVSPATRNEHVGTGLRR